MKETLKELYHDHLSKYLSEEITKKEWDILKEYIKTHKYWLNEDYSHEIPLSQAFTSWLEYVFEPFVQMIEKYQVMKYTQENIIRLYERLMHDWFMLKDMNRDKKFDPQINHVVEKYCLGLKSYPKWKKFKIWLKI